ncbi:MAG: RNA-binding cell elongation regulator Jag/EloR, partial [Dehalococcoidia bacterium]
MAKALQRLGLDRSQVEVEVISEGRAGLFGLGAEEARVRVRPLTTDGDSDDAVQLAREVVRRLLAFMGFETTVTSRPPQTPGDGLGHARAVLDVAGADLGLLIGRRGSTLASLQYLVNLIINHQLKGQGVLVGVDIEGYKRRREEALRNLALRLAERVRATGHTITMEPMPASERRIVHLALA